MTRLSGDRAVLAIGDEGYPPQLVELRNPPDKLFVIGNVDALRPGVAVVGARKATPYGIACARRFAEVAAGKGLIVVSGGARGCDAAAHRAAVEAGGKTVAVLGGGCDAPYPAANAPLFQSIVEAGGAVVSEYDWDASPLPYRLRSRNRIVAGLAHAVLIVEAGLPSSTYSIADEALDANRAVLAVPGAITSAASRGANRLICQGATPIVDDETLEDALSALGLNAPGSNS